jgi:ABC-2 type transport system permease protein
MNALQRVAVIVGYEWRRALAKKWFFALVILAFAIQVLIFVVFNFLFTNPPPGMPPALLDGLEQIKPFMWVVEVLIPQGFFMSLIVIMIAGGSMSEEYEHGTSDILLSKPITKLEYMTGKYLGGLSLLSFVAALTTILGVILAVAFFSPQESLQFIPHIYLAIVYSNLVFLSLAFMFSEVLRRTTLSYFSAIGVFIASMAISGVLSLVHSFTGEQLYLDVSKGLPDWGASNFPSFVMGKLVNVPNNPFISPTQGDFDLLLAGALIAAYTTIFIVVATIRLVRSDVTKKTA